MMVGAQGDEIPRVIVIVISIKMMDFNNQVPTANTTLALMVNEARCSIVFIGLVVGVVLSGPIKTIVTSSAASLLIRVFKCSALRTRSSKLRVFDTFQNMPRQVGFCYFPFTMRAWNFGVYATLLEISKGVWMNHDLSIVREV